MFLIVKINNCGSNKSGTQICEHFFNKKNEIGVDY